jgi:hypothetical protein
MLQDDREDNCVCEKNVTFVFISQYLLTVLGFATWVNLFIYYFFCV